MRDAPTAAKPRLRTPPTPNTIVFVRGRLQVLVFAVLAAAFLYAGTASSGSPGNWTRITTTNLVNFAEPGLARTSDGVLHVVWHKPVSSNREDLMHSAISPAGKVVGDAVAIQSGWNSLSQRPDLVVSPDGNTLRVFFAGLHSLIGGDPLNEQLMTATAAREGRSWTGPQRVTSASHPSYGSAGIGAAVGAGGTPIVAEGDPGNIFHFGIGGPDFAYESRGCCVYDPDIGVDSQSGQAFVAWFSNVNGSNGLYAQSISTSGLSGTPTYLPGSANADRSTANQPIQRTPITGRLGAGGVYVAYGPGYPTRKSVSLLRLGASKPLVAGRGSSIENVDVARAPEGRLWVMWSDGGKIYAVRTNKAATRVGGRVALTPPAGTVSIFGLWGEGSLGTLDLIAHAGTATNAVAFWHTQVLPPLDIEATGGVGVIRVKVTDAGDPVSGVAVTVAGHHAVTNGRGTASVHVKQKGTVTAKATKKGYRADTDRARVKQKKKKARQK